MKKVIDGVRYDTGKAKEIARYDNGLCGTDFHHMEETLYKTPNGRWFLAGEGGALSKYSEPVGNNGRGGSSDIIPMSEEEAREWLEEHDEVGALEEHFAKDLANA